MKVLLATLTSWLLGTVSAKAADNPNKVVFLFESHGSEEMCQLQYATTYAFESARVVEGIPGNTAQHHSCFQGTAPYGLEDVLPWEEGDAPNQPTKEGDYYSIKCFADPEGKEFKGLPCVGVKEGEQCDRAFQGLKVGAWGIFYHGEDSTCSDESETPIDLAWYRPGECYEDPKSFAWIRSAGCSYMDRSDLDASISVVSQSCFPGQGTVQLENNTTKRMDQLQAGDRVHVGRGEFSEVFMFSTQLTEAKAKFVKISTSREDLLLTKEHYLYINGDLLKAELAREGDMVTLADGSQARITQIGAEWADGLYNPNTLHGDIVVDGVLTSVYTGAVHPKLAHALLTPLRHLYGAGIRLDKALTSSLTMAKKILPGWVVDAMRSDL